MPRNIEHRNEWMRNRRAQLKARGMCIENCGRRARIKPNGDFKVHCKKCGIQHAANNAKSLKKIKENTKQISELITDFTMSDI